MFKCSSTCFCTVHDAHTSAVASQLKTCPTLLSTPVALCAELSTPEIFVGADLARVCNICFAMLFDDAALEATFGDFLKTAPTSA